MAEPIPCPQCGSLETRIEQDQNIRTGALSAPELKCGQYYGMGCGYGEQMDVTREKNCYCYTCKKDLHYLGVASHRAAHKRKGEVCTIGFTSGKIYEYDYSAETRQEREQ